MNPAGPAAPGPHGAHPDMDPLYKAIDWLAKQMGHSLHQAIVAVPIGSFAFSNVCDGWPPPPARPSTTTRPA